MKITSLKIERFGVWEGLNLPKVSRGLNVFYGPNEAGKTTLMQFIRTCLYGGADEERARYVQMALDGKGRRFAALSGLDVQGKKDGGNGTDKNKVKNVGNVSDASELRPEVKRILDAAKEADAVKSALDAKTAARDSARSWIGGSATVSSEFGEHRLERRYIRRDSSWQTSVERKSGFLASEGLINWSGRFYSLPGQKIAESLVVTGPDGARVGDYFAKSLTCNLDEATYNGVFAIGLDELQRLGMLNETEAAQMLYRLSVGVDRGAFVQVFQQIVAERNDLFDVKGKPSIVENLLAERDRARRKSSESAANLREYARLLEERRAVLEATKNLQERLEKATRQKRLRELAVQIAPVWDERDAVRGEIDAMGKVSPVEQSAVDECKGLIAAVDETAAKIKEIKTSYRALRDERDSIEIDPALDELSPRVAILESDLPRLREIDGEVGALRDELADLSAKLSEEEARVKSVRDGKLVLTPNALDAVNATLVAMKMTPDARFSDANANKNGTTATGASSKTGSGSPNAPIFQNKLAEEGLSFKEVEDFKIPARAVRRRRLALAKYREEFERVRAALAELVEKLEQGLTSRRQKNLTEAIERTGALLSGLRRRIEIERRVGEMTQYRKELERQNKTLAENQSITGGPLYALGAGVVVGGLLFGLSLFGKMELAVGLLGLLALIACVFYKTTIEKKNFQKLEDNQRRLGLLMKQLEQAQAEAKTLDERFPVPANSTLTFENRLQKAKVDLAFFESLAPVEAKWRETTKLFRAEEARVQKGEEALKKARKRWVDWLREAYLPTTLNATQVRDLLARVGLTEELRRQIDGVQAEIDYLLRERQGILDRLSAAVALLPKLDFQGKTPTPFELVPILRGKLDEHSETLRKRAEFSDKMAALKKEYRRLFLQRRAQARAVRKFLGGYRVKTLEALVGAVDRYSTFLRKSADLDAAQKRLDVGIGGFCTEEELGALLFDEESRADLPTAIENLTKRLEALDAELRGKLELSGRLSQQADAIAAKKESIRSRFDAAALDLRIAEMTDLWQSRAVAGKILEDVRRAYERERQPETLREASRYLRRLTENRYVNIWTPLGEDALFVDSAEGETLDVAALSRGTREQLFIAIRLALVVSFEKHGIQMPLVLDDVLVNFDVRRAATAAKVLCDFVKGGRQIFLFTCHEHICRLFLSLQVSVCVLPSSNATDRGFRVLLPPKSKTKGKSRRSVDSNVSIGSASVAGPTLAADPQRFDAPTSFEIVAVESEKNEVDSQTPERNASAAPTSGSATVLNAAKAEAAPDDEKSRKPYLVVDGSDEAQGLRLSEEVDTLDTEAANPPCNLSVAADLTSKDCDSSERADSNGEYDGSQKCDETATCDFNSNETDDDSVADDVDFENDAENDADAEDDSTAETSEDVDFSKYVFSSEPVPVDVSLEEERAENAKPNVEYVEALKNASLDGEDVELRALSEISPTFSTAEPTVPAETSDVPGAFELAEETAVAPVDVREASDSSESFDVDNETAAVANVAVSDENGVENDDLDDSEDEDGNEDEEDSLDDLESLDYDEWATVFLADSESNPLAPPKNKENSNDSFLDYFDENEDDSFKNEEYEYEDEVENDDEENFDPKEGEDRKETDD